MTVDDDGMEILTRFSAGFPKIMHLIGDWAYWTDQDARIDGHDAIEAIGDAAEDFGKKYVDQQVLAALRSTDYRSILAEITTNHGESFSKKDVEKALAESERKKLGNFLQKDEDPGGAAFRRRAGAVHVQHEPGAALPPAQGRRAAHSRCASQAVASSRWPDAMRSRRYHSAASA